MPGADLLRLTLLADGSSDRVLLAPIQWLVRRSTARPLGLQFADLRRLPRPPTSLPHRIFTAVDLFPCDVLLVHRDAEREPLAARRREILAAVSEAGASIPAICVVPVRMTEAWLLFDESAIRHAAGNPHGQMALNLPPVDQLESVPQAKAELHALLRTASGLHGQRVRRFSERTAVQRVVNYIDDFAPLRGLPAFAALERDLAAALAAVEGGSPHTDALGGAGTVQ